MGLGAYHTGICIHSSGDDEMCYEVMMWYDDAMSHCYCRFSPPSLSSSFLPSCYLVVTLFRVRFLFLGLSGVWCALLRPQSTPSATPISPPLPACSWWSPRGRLDVSSGSCFCVAHTHIRRRTRIHTYRHVHTYRHIHIHIFIWTQTRSPYIQTHAHVYAYMYTDTTHVHIDIYTYTRI